MGIQSRFPDYRTKIGLFLGYLAQKRSDDVFIIAHPRSGSTWLRTMLVNAIQPDANSNPDVFNRLIPAPSIWNIHSVRALSPPRLLTSHTSYIPGLPRVVYVVRDGRSALVSYYHYTIHRKAQLAQASAPELDFPAWFDRYYQGRYRHIWHQHVESWLVRGKQTLGERMLVVRFEDMKANPEAWVNQILEFSGITVESGQVATAIRQADLDNVRKVEKERWQAKGLGEPDPATSFYRGGQRQGWKAEFTPELTERFLSYSSKAMRLAGYQS